MGFADAGHTHCKDLRLAEARVIKLEGLKKQFIEFEAQVKRDRVLDISNKEWIHTMVAEFE